jgi:hypothetical protein
MLKYIARFVLNFFGWKSLFDKSVIKKRGHSVIVYPHTSIFDFLIILLYFATIPKYFDDLKILMRPQSMDGIFGSFLERLNCIRASKNEVKNSGLTKELINRLKKNPNSKLLISQKGTREYREDWRTSFWWIAKELNCSISSYGLNYETKELVLIKQWNIDEYESVEKLIPEIKREFSRVPQINLANECFQKEKFQHLSFIELLPFDPIKWSNNLMICICLLLSFEFNMIAFMACFFGSVFSMIYHDSN